MDSQYPSRSDLREARARSSRKQPARIRAGSGAFGIAAYALIKRARTAVRAAPMAARTALARMHALQLQRTLPSRVRRARFARFPRSRRSFAITAGVLVLSLGVIAAAVPKGPTEAERVAAYVHANAQSLSVSPTVLERVVTRDPFSATPGIPTLVAGGTNHDWAKLVMLFAGFPITESNVTVFTRWMRQENGSDDWFNRNNPLNNGWGSGGGGGLGTYDNLVVAAENAADALHSVGGYSGIVDAFAASAPTEVIEAAIWASPWASGHYANGGHWSYVPVPVVTAPPEAW